MHTLPSSGPGPGSFIGGNDPRELREKLREAALREEARGQQLSEHGRDRVEDGQRDLGQAEQGKREAR
ncbi:MAG: hypothetical protein AB1758_23380, partial [Candidatus Eremiobacterota bacterium]